MRMASCLAGLLLAAALSGCTTNPAVGNLKQYVATQKPRAQAGALKWSDYYRGLYNLGSEAGLPGDTLGRMNEAIRAAAQYESGIISWDDFEYRRRALDAADKSAQQQRTQQASAAQLAAATQLLQSSGPHTAPQPVVATPAGTIAGFLQSQSTNGALRYCRYSNGVVTTIRAFDFCPLNTQ